jgi:diguanylate cyclase (GGDEF)-like protein/PAS domain S-box-containing protein
LVGDARGAALAVAVPLIALAVLALGVAGALPWTLAVGLAALGSTAFAWPVARAERGAPLAVGLLVTALCAGAVGIADTFAPHAVVVDVALAVEIPLVGLFFAVGAYLLGLLVPDQRRIPLLRLRAWLDGASFSVCTLYTFWLLVIGRAGMRGASLTASLLGSIAAGAAVVGAVHAARYRRRMLWCGLGAVLSIAGLTALVVTLDYHGTPVALAVAALAITAAGPIIWYGSTRVPDRPGPARLEATGSSGYPVLALPLVGPALATGYQLVQQRSLDAVAIGLALAGIVLVVARELLASAALRRYADHLAEQGEQLRTLVFGAGDVALVLDERLVVRWQSPAAARQFGLSDQDVVGRPATAVLHPGDVERCTGYLAEATLPGTALPQEPCEVRLRDGFGAWRETEWRLNGPDPARPGWSLVVHVRDVSQRRELERTLRRTAYADRLTSLANRQGLRRAGEPRPGSGALMVIDLYGLTGVSDLHGSELGDTVLVEAARRLRTEVGDADVPARLGETRFAVLTQRGAVQAHLLASRLLNILSAPYTTPGTRAHLAARAGLADLAVEADFDEVLRRAELALRATRPGGTGAVEWYDEAMEARLLRRSALEQELPAAVSRGQLDLAYQPIVELPGGRPVGVEALLRWRHPTLGTVPPAELVPVAQELGVLDEIGAWVLHRACRQLSSWMREGRDLFLAVNVTAHELAAPHFVTGVVAALETHLVPPSALVIEVAEPQLVAARQDYAARPVFEDVLAHLAELRTLGVRAAVDNFGIGPTSLSQLRVLPLDLLKIDRLVFAPEGQVGHAGAIIDVMVKLGGQLGIQVLAQGLETPADLDVARAAGCRFGQGYLLSQPVPPEHLEAYLDQHRGSLT